uniref:Uncharacterized protein LOC111118883 isoform X2 n=1 Tax=Crassostrea virginica TaxID=6565 RepID=A0A8B8CES7_CRAVI|nr:uncharacterized protein LOC111118883 isoform X2 [Crassostrea virginica]
MFTTVYCLDGNHEWSQRMEQSTMAQYAEEEEEEKQDLPDESHKYEYFWRASSPFSQWYPCEFDIDGRTFNCAEQYMIYQKAVLMEDDEKAEIIMALDNPQEMKELGKQMKDIDSAVWNDRCQEVVEFSQNEELKQKLFSTYPRTLVVANQNDKFWGIGLNRKDRRAWNKRTWKGKNRLGEILTNVRDKLMESFLQSDGTKIDMENLKVTERPIDGNCKICYNAYRNTVFKPCGHVVCCWGCAKQFKKICPVCRAMIESVDKIFLA